MMFNELAQSMVQDCIGVSAVLYGIFLHPQLASKAR